MSVRSPIFRADCNTPGPVMTAYGTGKLGNPAATAQKAFGRVFGGIQTTMAIVALLSAHHCSDGGEPWGLLAVGGLPIAGRQLRQAAQAGVGRAIVKVEAPTPDQLNALERLGPDLTIVRDGIELAAAIGADDVLLFAEGLIVDQAVIAQMVVLDGAALAVWSGEAPPEAERIDHQSCWAGLARIPNRLVIDTARTLDDWDMQSTLLRVTSAVAPERVAVDAVGQPDWQIARTPDAAHLLTDRLLRGKQLGHGNWVLRYVQMPVAALLTRWLLSTRATAFALRTAGTVIGLAAATAFATGWVSTGLALALAVGFLICTAEILARVRLEALSQRHRWDLANRVIGYGWFIALAAWLARSTATGSPWLLAVILVAFSAAAFQQRRHFQHLAGLALESCGVVERRVGRMTADPDTLIWALIPFAWVGFWQIGLAVLAAYAGLLFFVTQAQLFRNLRQLAISQAQERV